MPTYAIAEGVRLLGPYQDSGYAEPRFLVRRADGKVILVPELVQHVLDGLLAGGEADLVAQRVSTAVGRELSTEGLSYLVDEKLRPLGLVESVNPDPDASAATEPVKPVTPRGLVLGLRLRRVLVPPRASRVLATALAPLFWPPVVIAALAALVWVDFTLFAHTSVTAVFEGVFVDPPALLGVIGIVLAGTLFHEFGHAAACRYGGAQPGAIGVGLYLIFPALYTDVTDSYRLNRTGRLRTDLGGVYFHVLWILGCAAAYLATGYQPLLLVILLVHLEALEQLLPFVRLDGYFVLADIAGVPDLFARSGGVLKQLLPGRISDPALRLRPITRALVTAWTLITLPLLAFCLGYLLWFSPQIALDTWAAMQDEWVALQAAVAASDIASVVVSALSLVLMPLPLLGLSLVLAAILVRLGGRLARRRAARGRRGVPAPRTLAPVTTSLSPRRTFKENMS